MPIIKSAKKKLKQDKKRQVVNQQVRGSVKAAIRAVHKKPSSETLTSAYSVVDTAAKKHVIHKNAASRLKSRLASFIAKSATQKPQIAK